MPDLLTTVLAVSTLLLLLVSVSLYRKRTPPIKGTSGEDALKEAKLLKLNRLYFFIMQMNQAIVKAKEELNLFKETCRIAVESGKFRMAWIGMLDEDHNKLIPVTYAGEEAEYLSKITIISVAGSPESMGPGGSAFREGKYFVCNDIESAPEMAPWREAALGRNYRSSIGLPLKRGNEVVGLFALYTDKKDFFDAEEIAMLEDITADISFALESYKQEAMRRRAEEELLKSKRSYENLTETSPVGIFHTDTSGYTTYVNPRWCQITGLPKGKALGNGWLDAVHPDDRDSVFEGWKKAIAEQTFSVCEYRFIRPNGKIAWVLGQAVPERGIDGEITGYVGTTTDITGRKIAEEEVLNKEKRFRALIENSTDGLSVIGVDGTVLDISPSGEKILSFSRNEVIGKIPKDIVHPEDVGFVVATFRDILDNPDHIPTIQYRHLLPGGGFRWIECSYKNLLNEPYINAIVLNYRDVTGQVVAKNAIINERNLSDTIIDSLPGIFYLYTEAGQFLRWNGSFEAVTGYGPDEIRRMHPLDFFDTDEKELLKQKIGNVFIVGEDHVQANFLLKTGAKIPYYFTGKSITYEGKRCLLGVGIDFSDRVQAQEKIKETTEQLRQLAAHLQNIREEERLGIARDIHDDLGQQLTAVKMSMVRLARQAGGDKAMQEDFQMVIDMIGKGIDSIRRISTQLRPGILDDLGLVEAMKWQIEEFEKRFSISAFSEFSESPDAISPSISINLFRIFQETLTNIARHAEAANIEVILHVDNRHLYLKVKDNGKGFNASEISSKRTLGLLGMKERTLMIGGQFAMESRPGLGTTIEIEIPYDKPLQDPPV